MFQNMFQRCYKSDIILPSNILPAKDTKPTHSEAKERGMSSPSGLRLGWNKSLCELGIDDKSNFFQEKGCKVTKLKLKLWK